MAASLARLLGGRSHIELDGPNHDLHSDKHVQVMQIELARKTVQEMRKCVSVGTDIQLGFGKHILLRYGNRTKAYCASVSEHPVEVYENTKQKLKFAGVITHTLLPEGAADAGREQSAESVAALDKLKNQFASIARDKEANRATLVDEVKRGRNGKITGIVKRSDSPHGNSRSGSPGLGNLTPRGHSSSNPPLPPTSLANEHSAAKTQAQRFVILHLLAIRPISLHDLCRLTSIPEPECRVLLEKFAERTDSDGKYELLSRWYKELDVWRFPYNDPADRQATVDNAVRAFDRQRIDPSDKLWQLLLPVDERGKGKTLSKLKLTNNYNQPHSQPKIPTNHRKQLGIALGGSSPLSKANNGAATPSHDEPKASTGDLGRSPKPNPSTSPAKKQSKQESAVRDKKEAPKKQGSRPKYLSAEFVHSSDDESDDDIPLSTIKQRDLPKPDTKRKAGAEDAKSDTDAATSHRAARLDSTPVKRRKTSSIDSNAQTTKTRSSPNPAGPAAPPIVPSDPDAGSKQSGVADKIVVQRKGTNSGRLNKSIQHVAVSKSRDDAEHEGTGKTQLHKQEKSKEMPTVKPPVDRYKLSDTSGGRPLKSSSTKSATTRKTDSTVSPPKAVPSQSGQQAVPSKRKINEEPKEKNAESAAKRRRGTSSSNPSSYSASPASSPSANSRPPSQRSSHSNSLTSPSLHDMDLKGALRNGNDSGKTARSRLNSLVTKSKEDGDVKPVVNNRAAEASVSLVPEKSIKSKRQYDQKVEVSHQTKLSRDRARVDEIAAKAQSAYVAFVKARVQHDSKGETNPVAWEKMHRLWQEYSYLRSEQRQLEGASPDLVLAEDWQAAVKQSEGSAAYFESKARELFPEYSALREKCRQENEDPDRTTREERERNLDRLDKLDASLRALARLLRAARNEEKTASPTEKSEHTQLRGVDAGSHRNALSRAATLERYQQYHDRLDVYLKTQQDLRARNDYPDLPDEEISKDRKRAQKLSELRAQITSSLEAMVLEFSKPVHGKVTRDTSSEASAASQNGDNNGAVSDAASDFAAAVRGPVLDATQAELTRWRTKARFYEWRAEYARLVVNNPDFGKFAPSMLAGLLDELRDLRREQIRLLRAHALDFGGKAEAQIGDVQTVAVGLSADA